MKLTLIKPGSFFRPARFATGEPLTLQGYEIPAGFVTDGATIPPFLWPLMPPLGRYAKAAVLHDYLLSVGLKREDAAQLFYQQMISDNVGRMRSKLLYYGVRLNDSFNA